MNRYSYLDTLREIEGRTVKTAEAREKDPCEVRVDLALHKVAHLLRSIPQDDSAVSYDDVYQYGVRNESPGFHGNLTPPSEVGRGASLRKVAHELRILDRSLMLQKAAQAKDIAIAAHGLTLLRDRLRSHP